MGAHKSDGLWGLLGVEKQPQRKEEDKQDRSHNSYEPCSTYNDLKPKQNTVQQVKLPTTGTILYLSFPGGYSAKTPPIQHLFALPNSYMVPLLFILAI